MKLKIEKIKSLSSISKNIHIDMLKVKYLFSLVLIFTSYRTTQDMNFVGIAILELAIIILVSNFLLAHNKIMGCIFHYVSLFTFNAQMISLIFRGSFISLVMLENIHSVQALNGNFSLYIPVVLLALIMTFLPIRVFKSKFISHSRILAIVLAVELVSVSLYSTAFSVFFNSYSIVQAKIEKDKLLKEIAESDNYTPEFYSSEVANYIKKPSTISDKPNIIVIFTEGLSQNILEDERNITPTISKFQKDSLSFSNYFNHTFATYRGIISQLYSGYQLEDNDENTLVSLQSALSLNGYHTYFLNSEPNNQQFSDYLNNMGFDKILTKTGKVSGPSNTLSDKESYELLFETIENQKNSSQPFFLGIYTFGTHLSLDSPDEVYGDGKDPMLNKFYNLDYQFKQFLDKFNQSSVSDNTIIVFSADHATAVDSSYKQTFPNYHRESNDLDRVPFMIYYKGIEAQEIDVQGRNSIDLTPTILDYVDISAENYFLGESLFAPVENRNLYDTIFYSSSDLLTSENGIIQPLQENRKATIEELMTKYFAAKTQIPLK